jgi:hypothetical protein
MIKGKDPEPDPYLRQMEPDPGGPKTCGSPTLLKTKIRSEQKYGTVQLVYYNSISVKF